jgi:hypothetical protein
MATSDRLAATIVAALAGTVLGATPANAGYPPPCRGSNLSIGQDRSGHDAGLGHFGMDIVVTNSVDQACTLRGYLRLRFLDAAQRPLVTRSLHGDTRYRRDPGPSTIVLRAGEQATANVMWAEATSAADPVVKPCYLRIGTPGAPDGDFTVPFDEDEPGILDGALVNTALATPRRQP